MWDSGLGVRDLKFGIQDHSNPKSRIPNHTSRCDGIQEPPMRAHSAGSRRILAAVLIALCLAMGVPKAQGTSGGTVQSVLDDLLSTDRRFSTASAGTDMVAGLSAMLAEDAAMILGGRTIDGKGAIVDALRAGAGSAQSRIEWTPLGGLISADGSHGFTLGVMTLEQPDKTRVPLKYLSYWVKRSEGWRVVAYKRGRASEGSVPTAAYQFSQPSALISPSSDAAALKHHEDSLASAERAFSDEAQRIGLGPAFAGFGRADAVNMGGATLPGFLVGADTIARSVGEGAPAQENAGSPVSWGPDKVIVASSGDLGVSIGTIRRNGQVPAGQPPSVPFFTIWRRASPADPWRYVAE
jgi:hypothetical protein